MIPYAILFNVLRYADIERYDGLWQDWLCMQIESGAEIEAWMMCLAENPIKYDTSFAERIRREERTFIDGVDVHPYTLAAGFLWMMFKEGHIGGDEIRWAIGNYDEESGIYIYEFVHEPDKRVAAEKYLGKHLEKPRTIFEENVWRHIPQETRTLFIQ